MKSPTVFCTAVCSNTEGDAPDWTVCAPAASCLDPLCASVVYALMYCPPNVVLALSHGRGLNVAVLPTSAVKLLMFTRLTPREPRRVVADSGGPSPRSSRFWSSRPVKSWPTVARLDSHEVGRHWAFPLQMKRLTSCAVSSCHM